MDLYLNPLQLQICGFQTHLKCAFVELESNLKILKHIKSVSLWINNQTSMMTKPGFQTHHIVPL